MENIVHYTNTFLKTFEEAPFNEVDSAVLAWLSYLKFPKELSAWTGAAPVELFHSELFSSLVYHVVSPKKTLSLLAAVVASPRFRNIKIMGYEQELNEDTEKQFAAVTYQLMPELYYVGFRGTDATFVGWKEDFNLSLEGPIPSQTDAVRYLQNVTERVSGSIIVGGHSKGGNLAVYAASENNEKTQDRVIAIYSHDGPGFKPEFMEREGFNRIKDKIKKTLPQSSLVGMIFEQECEYRIVKSSDIGIAQHNLLTWCVDENDFCLADDLTPDAKLLYRSLNKWLAEVDNEQREKLITAVFDVLGQTNASDFVELARHPKENVPLLAKAIADLDKPTKLFFIKLLSQLAASGAKSIYEAVENNLKPTNEEQLALEQLDESNSDDVNNDISQPSPQSPNYD